MKLIAGNLLAWLAEPALRSIAVACVAALLVAMIPGKRAVLRLYIWTGVLYVALAMPLLTLFLPRLKVDMPASAWPGTYEAAPAVPAPAQASASSPKIFDSSVNNLPRRTMRGKATQHADPSPQSPIASNGAESSSGPASSHATHEVSVNWGAIALAIYLLGFAILLARLLLGIRASRRLAGAAEDVCPRYFPRKDEVDDPHTSLALELLSAQSGLTRLKTTPRLKESAALLVPATVGILRPLILLPSGWQAWSEEELQAVLAHEISHVSRRDALTQLLSLLHRAIFWFSPLGWWLHRQLTDLAEQASDEAALAGGADRRLYAETLLGFFARLQSGPRRVRWHALSMAHHSGAGSAERRVDQILAWKGVTAMKKRFVIVLAALAAPVIFLAASLHPMVSYAQVEAAQPSTQPQAASASPPADARPGSSKAQTHAARQASRKAQEEARTADTSDVLSTQQMQDAQAAVAKAQKIARDAKTSVAMSNQQIQAAQEAVAKAEKIAPAQEKSNRDTNTINIEGGSFNIGSGPRYVMMKANSDHVYMSGDDEDLQHARRLRQKIKSDFIWFEHDEKSYVITDPAFLVRVTALFAPQEELGKQQDALGRQQDELGRQQDALSQQMEKVKVQIPDIRPQLERIRMRLKELQSGGATQRELGRVQSEIGELQSQIGRLQSVAGRQQSVIGRQQGELGRKQGELGRQQGALGRKQGELARQASRELRGMFNDAITRGIAKPE